MPSSVVRRLVSALASWVQAIFLPFQLGKGGSHGALARGFCVALLLRVAFASARRAWAAPPFVAVSAAVLGVCAPLRRRAVRSARRWVGKEGVRSGRFCGGNENKK